MMDYLEKLAARFLIWRLKIGYGANCKTSDLDDFSEMYKKGELLSESIAHSGRCGSCQAKETIQFLERHIDLLDT